MRVFVYRDDKKGSAAALPLPLFETLAAGTGEVAQKRTRAR